MNTEFPTGSICRITYLEIVWLVRVVGMDTIFRRIQMEESVPLYCPPRIMAAMAGQDIRYTGPENVHYGWLSLATHEDMATLLAR